MLVIIKIFITICVVVGLSLIAERVSPKVAGILSGYPLGAAISLFFYGIEINPEFSGQSAIYMIAGLVATQSFVYCYYKASFYPGKYSVFIASLSAVTGYMITISLIYSLSFNRISATLFTGAFVLGFAYLFRKIENIKIDNQIKITVRIIFIRATVAASMILIITGIAKTVGIRWAGLFSAFPVTLYPLILIIHLTYSTAHVHTIIKNFPTGLGSLILYGLSVSIFFPMYGVYIGTVLSFIAATAYLVMYQVVTTKGKINIQNSKEIPNSMDE